MKSLFILTFYFLRSLTILMRPSGAKKLAAENLMLRKQLIVSNRNRKKAPNLTMWERLYFACLSAIVLKPSTLLKLHQYFVKKKYQKLFSNKSYNRPGPKGPSQDLINAVVTMKQLNPRFGCVHIAMQINVAFGVNIDKNVVRRILAQYYKPTSDDNGPSWLSFLGHMKDSL